MKTTKYTREEINIAMAQAKNGAEQVYTLDYIKQRNPRVKVPVSIKLESKEFKKYDHYEIDDLLELLDKAKRNKATNIHFEWSSYEDNEDIEMIFNADRWEFDSEYETRIKNTHTNVINGEVQKVYQQMSTFNREIDQYLALHRKYGQK